MKRNKDVVELMKDKISSTAPGLNIFVQTDQIGPKLHRFFVWRLHTDAPTDKGADKSFCWHMDGDEHSSPVIAAVAIIHTNQGTNTACFAGTTVHLSARSDEKIPTPEDTITFHTPHNSMYVLSGGTILHSVSHYVPPDVTRYAFVLFMRSLERVRNTDMRAYLRKQWKTRVKRTRGSH